MLHLIAEPGAEAQVPESSGVAGRRVALFVDGDNLSPALAGPILAAAGRFGRVDLKRVYAAEGGFRAWQASFGLRLVQVGGAKNGTDLLLCIDAVETACRGGFDAFAIASDDRDFSHLAHWLRERGLTVLGLGTTKAAVDWRATCSEFRLLGDADRAGADKRPGPALDARPAPPPAPLTEIDAQIRQLIAAEGDPGGLAIQALGARMGALHKVTLATVAASNWRAYLERRPDLYALDPRGLKARVRWIGP